VNVMPIKLSKKETKAYKKRLGSKIYQEAYNKEKARQMKIQRAKRIKELQAKATLAAQKKYGKTGKEKLQGAMSRAKSAYQQAQKSYAKSQPKTKKKTTRAKKTKSVWEMDLSDF